MTRKRYMVRDPSTNVSRTLSRLGQGLNYIECKVTPSVYYSFICVFIYILISGEEGP